MGAGVSSMAAGFLAPKIASVTAIEALGPLARKSTAFETAAAGITSRSAMNASQSKLSRFSSIDEAVQVRMKTGMHYISETGTRLLVARGVRPVKEGGFEWSSDPIAVKGTPFNYSEDDVASFLNRIECKVLNIYGDQGLFKWFNLQGLGARTNHVKDLKVVHLPGGHHPHLEPDTVDAVVSTFLDFMFSTVLVSKGGSKL
ncbi:hypothetical protein HDU98_004846 [Podochytrium sp. JEL0797]|nr:hypothetical protein HDU98_004846 [Podochytrium sp. JEL0797]